MVNRSDRSEIEDLKVRLFGHDGQTGGVLGEIRSDIAQVKKTLDRWDGAITAVKVGAGFLTVGGIATLLRALFP